jgi:purine-binding chemotaxis protein CheW
VVELVKHSARGLHRRSHEDQGPVREFLAFGLGNDVYGVELTRIREILSPPPITEVPRAPRAVLGVCSVRGLLVTVVDLRRRLDLPEQPATRRTRVLLTVGPEGETFGVLVDEVKQVVRLADGQIELAPAVLGGDVSEHVLGLGRPDPENVIILLDLGSVVGHLKEDARDGGH